MKTKIIEDRIKYLDKLMAREDESDKSRQLLSFTIEELYLIKRKYDIGENKWMN